uniref:L domain-like protein n=1 Tax=Odontella aurita TaxID=265563 RepID=A0A7S4MD84_9STRA
MAGLSLPSPFGPIKRVLVPCALRLAPFPPKMTKRNICGAAARPRSAIFLLLGLAAVPAAEGFHLAAPTAPLSRPPPSSFQFRPSRPPPPPLYSSAVDPSGGSEGPILDGVPGEFDPLFGCAALATEPRVLDMTGGAHEPFRYEWGTWVNETTLGGLVERIDDVRLRPGAYDSLLDEFGGGGVGGGEDSMTTTIPTTNAAAAGGATASAATTIQSGGVGGGSTLATATTATASAGAVTTAGADGGESSASPATTATTTTTTATATAHYSLRYDALLAILSSAPVTDPSALTDPGTAPGKALLWLAVEDAVLILPYQIEEETDAAGDGDGDDTVPALALEPTPAWKILQRYAVVVCYYSTAFPSKWSEEAYFLTPYVDECKWRTTDEYDDILGVGCGVDVADGPGVIRGTRGDPTIEGRVRSLSLGDNRLEGSIPPDIALLTDMQVLDLGYNPGLIGELPTTIGKLTSLRALELYDSSIEGPIIPPGGTTGPRGIALLTELRWIDMGGNLLTGPIPSELGLLTNLAHLYLEENSLSGTIPTEFGNMTRLENMWMFFNDDTYGGTGITGRIPAELGRLTELWQLQLQKNTLSGPVPAEMGTLTNLQLMDLGENALTGSVPPEWSGMTGLMTMILHDNDMDGRIPGELGQLGQLEYLDLSENKFGGPLPPGLFDGTMWMYWADLSGNSFEGTLPGEVGRWLYMEEFRLSSNAFSGPLPTELGSLAKLQTLDLKYNDFSGPVPPHLADLTSLTDLDVSTNNFNGSLNFMCGRDDPIYDFVSDCYPGVPGAVTCGCCTSCCRTNDNQGVVCVGNPQRTLDL